ncbi:Metallo-hydrolase/oxidoreductase [Athelia psychrophila]|uniref:Metallo-hydrolase/oxidoreductase n=1 Tax=Athelia psychrophila TaxID=1759441 RepID=A0A167XAV4_9AGAM|nr:Metallo-hydrolase/oxidoreductase [Fibularhizoctonia sp. CBS 109695]
MAASDWSLPADTASQSYVSVSTIPVGSLYLADKWVFEDCAHQVSGGLGGTGRRVPSFSFLVQHEQHGRLLFDLGQRKNREGYPPSVQKYLHGFYIKCDQDIVDLLEAGNVRPRDIGTVIYSHLHWDHVGDLTPFASALLVAGGGAAQALADPYPQNPESEVAALPKGQKVRYEDFSSSFALGPFPRAVDYFNDGSFYLVDAPGHAPGHLNAIARIAPNQFVLLAADACHHRLCFSPGERLASGENHDDIEAARKTIGVVKAMHGARNVVVLLAHDETLLQEPGAVDLFPSSLNSWASREIERKHQV